jgi:hypothetical protein
MAQATKATDRIPLGLFRKIMKDIRWKVTSSDAKNTELVMNLPNRRLACFAKLVQFPNELVFYDGAVLIFYPVRDAVDYITQATSTGAAWWLVKRNGEGFRGIDLTVASLSLCTETLIGWAQSVDPCAALEDAALVRPGFANIFVHVAALALLGEVKQIEHYIEMRRRDEDADLHPIVKLHHLDRALVIAQGMHPTLKPGMSIV